MKLSELIGNTKVLKTEGDLEKEVFGIAYDSRKVMNGDLFIAIPGATFDGSKFISTAIDFGAGAIVTEVDNKLEYKVPKILVPSARAAMADLSEAFFGFPSSKLSITGITGTNGKTTTSYLIESIFKAAGLKTGVIGTIEMKINDKVVPSNLTTPESLDLQRFFRDCLSEGVSHVVMEVSSHALAMKRVRGVQFDRAVYTNLSHDHLDFHRTMEAYFDTKMQLFRMLGSQKNDAAGIVNIDDGYSEAVMEETNCATVTYSLKKKADVTVKVISSGLSQMTALVSLDGMSFEVSTPLVGEFNAYNIAAACALAKSLGIGADVMKQGIEAVKNVPGRVELVKEGQDFDVMVDFAHSPDSLERLLKAVSQVKKGRVIAVFGSAGNRDRLKRPVMGRIAAKLADISIITTDDPYGEDPVAIIREIENGFREAGAKPEKDYLKITERAEAIRRSIEMAKQNDIVVIAGRGHEKFQDIKGKKVEIDDKQVAKEAIREKLR